MMVDVLIASDLRLFGEGLCRVLAAEDRIRVVALARARAAAVARCIELRPQVMLVDLSMTDALELVRDLNLLERQPKIVAIGLDDSAGELLPFAEAGISGFLCRNGSLQELVETVESVLRAELPCSPKVAATLLRRLTTLARSTTTRPICTLTPREREITGLLDRGLTNKQISSNLGIEIGTVKNHIHNILEKLEAGTRGEAAAKARQLDLLPRTAHQPG